MRLLLTYNLKTWLKDKIEKNTSILFSQHRKTFNNQNFIFELPFTRLINDASIHTRRLKEAKITHLILEGRKKSKK